MNELRNGGRIYETTVGSDVTRDGFYAELTRNGEVTPVLVAEAFWSDETNDFSFTAFESPIPVSVLEAFLAEARLRVPPQHAERAQQERNFFVHGRKPSDA